MSEQGVSEFCGWWSKDDLARLGRTLANAKMTLGQLLDEMLAAAKASPGEASSTRASHVEYPTCPTCCLHDHRDPGPLPTSGCDAHDACQGGPCRNPYAQPLAPPADARGEPAGR